MAKKFVAVTYPIKILTPDGQKKIDDMIALGLIKIDDEFIRLQEESAKLMTKLASTQEQFEFYIRRKLLE